MIEPDDQERTSNSLRHGTTASRDFRAYAIALLAVSAAIAYGSLYPFDFRSGIAAERAPAVLRAGWRWTSLSDTLANVALFVPLGFFGALAVRGSRRPLVVGTAVVLGAMVLATTLQTLQLFIPSRSSAVADVVWNMFGLVAGVAAGWVAMPWISASSTRLDAWDRAILVLALAWCVGELLPLVPALDWSGIKGAVKRLVYSPRADLGTLAGGASQVLLIAWMAQNRLGATRAAVFLPLGLATVLGLRLLIVGQHLTPAVPAAYVLGYLLWRAFVVVPKHNQDVAVCCAALLGYTIAALAPFELRLPGTPFGWVPFGAMLQGSMLANTASLLEATFTLAGLLLVARHAGAALGPFAIILALWVALLEWTQTWIVGRTSDVTPALLALGAGVVVGWLIRPAAQGWSGSSYDRDVLETSIAVAGARAARPSYRTSRAVALGATLGSTALIAAAIAGTLRIPGVPYNLLELFRGDAAFPLLMIFALAILWVGAGARWGGERLAESPRPTWIIPIVVFLQAMVSLALLYASVTDESVADIAGSNNLYWFVTNKDIWGATAREFFLAIGSPTLVAIFERPVRYAALYGPLALFLTVMLGIREATRSRSLDARWFGWTFAVSVLTLWLCKAIAFDWSSTDNLNELIARNGPWGLGGGGYLYALVALICATAVMLSGRLRSVADAAGRVAFLLMTVPTGWWLLNEGLESRVTKYSKVFSGAQFLLGPDRAHLLDDAVLLARWTIVQFAAVLVIAAGIAVCDMWLRGSAEQRTLRDSP